MKLRHAQKNAEQIDAIKSDLLIYNNLLRKSLTLNEHIIKNLEEITIRNEQIMLIVNKKITLVVIKMGDIIKDSSILVTHGVNEILKIYVNDKYTELEERFSIQIQELYNKIKKLEQ